MINWWLSAAEAADLAGVTCYDVRQAARSGKVTQQGRGRHRRYRREDVERWSAGTSPAVEPIDSCRLIAMAERMSLATDLTGLSRKQIREGAGDFQALPPRRITDRFRILRREAARSTGSPGPLRLTEGMVFGQADGGHWTSIQAARVPELGREDFLGLLLWASAQSAAAGAKGTEDHWSHSHFHGLVELRRSGLLGETA